MTDFLYQQLTYDTIGAAMEVHSLLGPGFPEDVYQKAMEYELRLRAIPFEAQKQIQVTYKSVAVAEYYLDLVVDSKIVVELKAAS